MSNVRDLKESEGVGYQSRIDGYPLETDDKVDDVNHGKAMEERCLRWLDTLKEDESVDQRWLAIGRTHMEQAWMAVTRSIMKPGRVTLPGDKEKVRNGSNA